MQMPILSYPNFSQFLQLHQQQQLHQHHHQQYSSPDVAGSESSGDTSHSPSPPSSPPLSPPISVPDKAIPGKSFTIDAILGLPDSSERDPMAFHSAFHPRLRMSDLSRLSGVLTREQNMSFPSPRMSDKSLGDVSKKSSGKSKRVRTIFTPEQLERLEAEFERQQYMVGPERLYLAHTLQLTEAQVKVWFQNRRIKWRKQHLELQQQRLAVLKQRQRVDAEDSGDSEDSSSRGKIPPNQTPNTFSPFVSEPSASDSFPLSYPIDGTRCSRELVPQAPNDRD